jgi:outer membrane protein OmpA-like peptidoglycan-associated protein
MFQFDSRLSRGLALATVLGASGLLAACQTPKPSTTGPLIVSTSNCADFKFSVYFEPDSDTLSPSAKALFDSAKTRSAACRVTGIKVLGLADAPGTPEANLALSKRRADAVAGALNAEGFQQVEFDIKAVGSAPSPSGAPPRGLRRRVDVWVHLAPKA